MSVYNILIKTACIYLVVMICM